MDYFPKELFHKISMRIANNSLRKLPEVVNLVDFSSNDYLGYSRNQELYEKVNIFLLNKGAIQNGATGSRLLTGNHQLSIETEIFIAQFHKAKTALLFNSGFDANIGFFGAIPQRNDIILYDEFCHASIREGIRLSGSKAYKYPHNDILYLKQLFLRLRESKNLANSKGEVYVVTESVFSMDGDSPDLELLTDFCCKEKLLLVIDEAHALGVFGYRGEGIVNVLGLEDKIFARIVTFGKGLGCHGAAILGSQELILYLINFSKSFIYTTALPPHSVATILMAYKQLQNEDLEIRRLRANIDFFNQEKNRLALERIFVYSKSSIQSAIILGNDKVKNISHKLKKKGFDVKPILSPTVPIGQERLRFCLHSFNNEKEISEVLECLANFILIES